MLFKTSLKGLNENFIYKNFKFVLLSPAIQFDNKMSNNDACRKINALPNSLQFLGLQYFVVWLT